MISLQHWTSIAMASGDDRVQNSVSSLVHDAVNSKQSWDELLVEDLAFADSCLIKDPDMLDSSWNSLEDASSETLTSRTVWEKSSSSGGYASPGGADIKILPSNEETEALQNVETMIIDDNVSNDESAGKNSDDDDPLFNEKTDTFLSRFNLENVFLSTYNESLREISDSDSETDLGFPAFETEPFTEDIFKVWDLDIPAEEDELIKQLNKALVQSSFQPEHLTSDDAGVFGSLDDLISGIADLSLN